MLLRPTGGVKGPTGLLFEFEKQVNQLLDFELDIDVSVDEMKDLIQNVMSMFQVFIDSNLFSQGLLIGLVLEA